MNIKKLIFFVFLFISFKNTYSQSVEEYANMLAAENYQQWILDNTEVHLGDDDCENGMVYTFFRENNVAIRKVCVNHKWSVDNLNWEVAYEDEIYKLKISDGVVYEIDFLSINDQLKLRLRVLVSPDKIIPVNDYYFIKN